MPIKKCKYCKSRMNKVVWGMPMPDDYENADDFTEFRGCIITEPTETWRCDFCDSKIIPSHTPEGGLCIEEAPAQVTNALRVFASRINQIADLHYLPDSIERSQVATLECGGYEALNRQGLGYSFDHFAADETLGLALPDPFNAHEKKGDFLAVEFCPNLELRFYFNGTGELVTHVAASKQNLSQPRDLYDFDASEFSGIETQIEDLITGNKLLLALTAMILKTQDTCDAESCDHPETGGWEGLQGLRELLSHPFASLSASFPTVSAHELTKQANEVNF
jgi:hypothetical protein